MQLAAKVGPKHLEEFFQKVGQVREVKMIADKNSRRSKGIAYVEFHDESSVMEVSDWRVPSPSTNPYLLLILMLVEHLVCCHFKLSTVL